MDMLTFSKEREPEPVPSSLNEVVSDVVELMQARADELGAQLHWRPDPEIPTLVFDPEAIHRAVLNVVTNALDASSEGDRQGQVHVATSYLVQEGKVQIFVDDNGQGIPPDQLDKLFSPFVSRKGKRGTGLGLPVSKKIVNEHGGQILVKTELGQGSRFLLELPAVVPGTAEHKQTASD
jgi:signal transduction histidine kinase